MEDHSANGILLGLTEGVVFVEVGIIDPLVHDVLGLEESGGLSKEIR